MLLELCVDPWDPKGKRMGHCSRYYLYSAAVGTVSSVAHSSFTDRRTVLSGPLSDTDSGNRVELTKGASYTAKVFLLSLLHLLSLCPRCAR